jgi:tetratricopeptide (TPR) repeat protein
MDPEVQRFSDGLYHYLLGQMFFGQENYQNALQHFAEAGKLIDEPAPELRKRLAELRLKAGELQMALEESTRAVETEPHDPATLLLHAGILDSVGRSEESIPFYERAIALEPERVDAYVLLSGVHMRRNEYERSIFWLNKLLEHAPDEASAYYFLGRAHELQGKLPQAQKELERAYEIDPDNHNLGIDLARLALKQDNPKRAEDLCRDILKRNPRHLLARRVLGFLLVGENQLDEALQHLSFLEKEESNPTETRFQIALIHLGKRNFTEAERELSLVLAADPDHSQARYFRATLYAGTGRKNEAVKELLKIKLGEGNYLRSRTLAAFILRQQSKLAQAEKVIGEGLKVEENNKDVLSYLLSLQRDQNKLGEAEETAKKALSFYPEDERFIFDYGIILYEQGREQEAEAQMQRILQLNPSHSDALNYLAYSLAEKKKDLDKAEEMVQAALRSRPKDGFFLDTLGWIYYQKGNYAAALETLTEAAQISGSDPVILEHLADTLAKLGQKSQARENYERVLDVSTGEGVRSSPRAEDTVKRIKQKLAALSSSP